MPDTNKNKGPGLIGLVLSTLIATVAFLLLRGMLRLGTFMSIVLGVIIANSFSSALLGRQSKGQRLRHYIILFVALWGISLGLKFTLGLLRTQVGDDLPFDGEESVAQRDVTIDGDTIAVLSSDRVWRDNFGTAYQAKFSVRERDYSTQQKLLRSYKAEDLGNFWGTLYAYLADQDGPKLDLLVKEFGELGSGLGLSPMEFADMMVTGIQDIPYSLVFQEECLPPQAYEKTIAQILLDCPQCCIGEIPFGIQNPVSFIGNLKGDCDTRTVLLYTLFKAFGFDVAILNSDYYRHSILGLNLPASGLHKLHYGKRYFVWETTAKYFKIGQLPPLVSDLDQWEVVLTSK
mgnify:CR=1 FL=1